MIFTFVIISRRYFFISLQPRFSEMDFIAVLKKIRLEVLQMKMTIISVVPTDMEVSAGKFLNEVYCKDENGRVGLMYSAKSYKPGDAADVVLTLKDGKFKAKLA